MLDPQAPLFPTDYETRQKEGGQSATAQAEQPESEHSATAQAEEPREKPAREEDGGRPTQYSEEELTDFREEDGEAETESLAIPAGRGENYNPAYEFAAKTLEKRELEAKVRTLTAELGQLETEVIDQLNELQMSRMTTSSGATVHLKNDARPSLVSDPDGSKTGAHDALRSHDLEYLITEGVNANTLRGYVNELKRKKQELPPGLARHINLNERPRVSVRAS